MRAILIDQSFDELLLSSKIEIKDENVHHLKNVLRVKVGEKILLLNGEGFKALSEIKSISKKIIDLEILEAPKKEEPKNTISIGYCLTKRDSFEQALVIATEIGCRDFYPLYSQYSQRYEINRERVQKILKGANEQSNNPFSLTVHTPQKFDDFKFQEFAEVHLYESKAVEYCTDEKQLNENRKIVLIGPEGGFSTAELNSLSELNNLHVIHLDTWIMRSPHALAFILGRESIEKCSQV